MNAKQSLTIGIDIDGTVTDPGSMVPMMNESFGKNLRYEECVDYNLATIYNISEAEFVHWLEQNGERLYREAPLHGTADQVLRNWYNRHRLIYISAREQKHLAVTEDWFHRHAVPYHEIALLGSHDKLAAAKERNVDLFIEDRLENALQLAESLQIPIFLFDTPYNQSPLPPLIRRVTSWQEIAELIDQL
ncbi:5' nucleotidase, NT5C type [Brevibacillus fulvus]|uniref:Nucleotidase n=1 Tax=Brevibacillus fulvus TaxID=1125967 RepID=A0A939BST8_9BACL|nr:hypothetical protein [Brevibacillus fulvus]MBM7590823.1 putative HAD superfamily protein [Brevibacillus fulvus]